MVIPHPNKIESGLHPCSSECARKKKMGPDLLARRNPAEPATSRTASESGPATSRDAAAPVGAGAGVVAALAFLVARRLLARRSLARGARPSEQHPAAALASPAESWVEVQMSQ